MSGLPEAYERYKDAFGIRPTGVLGAFERLFATDHDRLEMSAKIERGRVYPTRFNVIYDRAPGAGLDATLSFLRDVAALDGVSLDLSLVAALLRGLDLGRVGQAACGIDWRPEDARTRAKVWVMFHDQAEKVNELLTLHGETDEVLDLMNESVTLAGVDLGFEGHTRLKLYPRYTDAHLRSRATRFRLARHLGPKAIELARRSRRTNISFEPDMRKVIHYAPHDADALVAEIGNPDVGGHHERCRALGLALTTLSLVHDEMSAGAYETVNLYYEPEASVRR